MQGKIINVLFALLRNELFHEELSEDTKNLIDSKLLLVLYKVSKKHDLGHLVGDALNKNGLLDLDSEIKSKFKKEINMAYYRYAKIQYEFEQICKVLEDEKIPFIPLKGSIIRQYYPEPWMRTSCDIDILVHEEVLEQTAQLICDKLNYNCEKQKTINDLTFFTPSGVHIELHYDLTEGEKYGNEVLKNIWKYTHASLDNEYRLLLNDDAFYYYHLSHMIKHFENGGCGIRPFLDLYFLNTKIEYDKQERIELIKKGGFEKFAVASEELAYAWFENKEISELGKQMQIYVITGGVYGNLNNRVRMQQAKHGSKFKYLLSRIFISNKELKLKYPKLEKRPWLTPFYHIVRWLKPLYHKETNSRSLDEFTKTSSVDKASRDESAKMLKELGLK